MHVPSLILNISHFVEPQQSSNISTQSHLNIMNGNLKSEIVNEHGGENKVQINVLNTYKDFNYVEEYFVMIFNTASPLLFFDQVSSSNPPWFAMPVKTKIWCQLIGGVT